MREQLARAALIRGKSTLQRITVFKNILGRFYFGRVGSISDDIPKIDEVNPKQRILALEQICLGNATVLTQKMKRKVRLRLKK